MLSHQLVVNGIIGYHWELLQASNVTAFQQYSLNCLWDQMRVHNKGYEERTHRTKVLNLYHRSKPLLSWPLGSKNAWASSIFLTEFLMTFADKIFDITYSLGGCCILLNTNDRGSILDQIYQHVGLRGIKCTHIVMNFSSWMSLITIFFKMTRHRSNLYIIVLHAPVTYPC